MLIPGLNSRLHTHTDLLLVFLSECIELLGKLFGLVLPEGLGADQILLYLLHLEATEDKTKQKFNNIWKIWNTSMLLKTHTQRST